MWTLKSMKFYIVLYCWP